MAEMSTCIFCGRRAVVESISKQAAYCVKCPCGIYRSTLIVEQDFKDMGDIDRQAVSNFIKQCRAKNEIPELHILQGTGELEKIIEKYKLVYILFHFEFTVVGGEERAFIHLKSLSPVAINQRLKFGIPGQKEQYDFDQLRDVISKRYFKRGGKLYLFVVNTETEEKQDFGINIPIDWPEGLAEDKKTFVQSNFEITSYLKNIGIL